MGSTLNKKIAYLTWGNGSQIRSYQDFSYYIDELIYIRNLEQYVLFDYAAIVVPDGMNIEELSKQAKRLNDYVRLGGFLIIFHLGGVHEWLDVVDLSWQPIHIQDWLWWQKPGKVPEIYQPDPKHPICNHIPLPDMQWHWGGVYDLHPQAISALNLENDQGCLFLDFQNLEGGGRLIVSTLDPHLHNGERFMPATTRFLRNFYPWLNQEVGITRTEPHRVTYVQCLPHPIEWSPPGLAESLSSVGFNLNFCPLYQLTSEVLDQTDILYIPSNHDQYFLQTIQGILLDFLTRGGHMIINSEPVIPWLPFLTLYRSVPPRPFTNLKVRVHDDRCGFFQNMDEGFDGWEGVLGQYARGWTEMPSGAICLTEVGSDSAPKPADWLWRYPTETEKGGFVFMHNGDNMIRYPDHGPHKEQLVRDICLGLRNLTKGQVNL